MAKQLTLPFLFVLLWFGLSTRTAQAQTIRRVNNNVGISGANVYTTLQAAHDAAVAGDIILVEPSTTSYGGLTCTKQLTINGPGYFLDLNQPPVLQVTSTPATTGNLDFQAGSDGSTVAGLSVSGYILLRASNLTCVRNHVTSYIYPNYNANNSNVVVRQNYSNGMTYGNDGYTSTNLVVTNNIATNVVNLSAAGFTGLFANNVVLSTGYFDTFTAKNNYFSGLSTTANTTWQYNLVGGTLPTAGLVMNNNTGGVTTASTFVLGPGSTQYDAWYKLKSGNTTASGKGESGADIGAYGSLGLTGAGVGYAYHLSGVPAIPAIYQLSQVVNGTQLNVTLSTRANN